MSLNGHQVFPVSFKGDQRLVATQMPHDVSTIVYMVDREKFPQVTLDNSRLVTTDVITESGAREYTFELSIFAVDATPVKLEGLQMIILQSPSGELSFGPIRPIPKNETCGANIKCMISKMMFRLRHMRKPWGRKGGCKGRKGGKHHGGKIDNHPVEGLDAVPPKHHHHHHPHRPHHGVFHRIAAQVLLPIFVGIAAGMTVSLIGLVLGHGFLMLWYKFRGLKRGPCCKAGRRRRSFFCHRRRERQEREALAAAEADGEVEKGLLQEEEHVECPPAYVDAPVSDLEVVEKQ
ncbi:hypothetical protein FN846DRAFT_958589 [Sphaerosporella brunnea]|uniref:Uncharacterized protein n=1 Tax=Sphaerosporella brunnea TaxID=1250544 RepID=A0A5J5ER76_9PEZI|nr:hypothetical protein FN846DRAFT_958589 [Sphaerosporella brunnea]